MKTRRKMKELTNLQFALLLTVPVLVFLVVIMKPNYCPESVDIWSFFVKFS